MAVPTTKSRGSQYDEDFKKLTTTLIYARSLAVNHKAAMAAGPVTIESIIDGIYIPFAAKAANGGIWNTILNLTSNPAFMDYYYEQISLRFPFDADSVNLATDRITVDGNKFNVDDPVKIEGAGTPPGGLTKGTNYWVFDKNPAGTAISFSATVDGAIINLTTGTAGLLFVEYRGDTDFSALNTALEAVIDQIISDVPVTATTLELRMQKFDKALASSDTGISDVTLSSAQTANLQTDLQSVVDAIEAPI